MDGLDLVRGQGVGWPNGWPMAGLPGATDGPFPALALRLGHDPPRRLARPLTKTGIVDSRPIPCVFGPNPEPQIHIDMAGNGFVI